jgi:hypothetical protein
MRLWVGAQGLAPLLETSLETSILQGYCLRIMRLWVGAPGLAPLRMIERRHKPCQKP